MIDNRLPELPCRELVELITDYLEDRLSPVDRVRFEAHLGECDACRTYLDQFRQTIRALGRLTRGIAFARNAERAARCLPRLVSRVIFLL